MNLDVHEYLLHELYNSHEGHLSCICGMKAPPTGVWEEEEIQNYLLFFASCWFEKNSQAWLSQTTSLDGDCVEFIANICLQAYASDSTHPQLKSKLKRAIDSLSKVAVEVSEKYEKYEQNTGFYVK